MVAKDSIEPPTLADTYAIVRVGIEALGIGDAAAMAELSRLTALVPAWFRQHREMLHTFPSPSGLMRCRAQQWYDFKKVQPDQTTPPGWKVAAAMGIISEPYWLAVLAAGGFDVSLPNEAFKCGDLMIAHPDAILNGKFTVELKRMSGWGFKNLIERPGGIMLNQPDHFAQCQLEMHAAGAEWGLYLTHPSDHGMLQSTMRQKTKYGRRYILQEVYVEWLRRDDQLVEGLLKRAELIAQDMIRDEPPPREYSGREWTPQGKQFWPCAWCLWLATCNRDSEERVMQELRLRGARGEVTFLE